MLFIGTRGHDVPSESPEALCNSLNTLGLGHVQLVLHKSFAGFAYTAHTIATVAVQMRTHAICTAVYGCYIDPRTQEGRARFLEQMHYAKQLGATVIATETSTGDAVFTGSAEQAYAVVLDAFRLFAAQADALGVDFAVEAVKGHPIDTPAQTQRLLLDIASPHMRVVFDPANLIDSTNVACQQEIFAQALALYGERIAAVHYKDRPDVDYTTVLRFALQKQIPVICEDITGTQLERAIKFLRTFTG